MTIWNYLLLHRSGHEAFRGHGAGKNITQPLQHAATVTCAIVSLASYLSVCPSSVSIVSRDWERSMKGILFCWIALPGRTQTPSHSWNWSSLSLWRTWTSSSLLVLFFLSLSLLLMVSLTERKKRRSTYADESPRCFLKEKKGRVIQPVLCDTVYIEALFSLLNTSQHLITVHYMSRLPHTRTPLACHVSICQQSCDGRLSAWIRKCSQSSPEVSPGLATPQQMAVWIALSAQACFWGLCVTDGSLFCRMVLPQPTVRDTALL